MGLACKPPGHLGDLWQPQHPLRSCGAGVGCHGSVGRDSGLHTPGLRGLGSGDDPFHICLSNPGLSGFGGFDSRFGGLQGVTPGCRSPAGSFS